MNGIEQISRTRTAALHGILTLVCLLLATPVSGYREPVTPNASPEARALLRFLYDIRGKAILSGQMGEKWDIDNTFEKVNGYTGNKHYPAIWGCDFLFGRDKRQNVVDGAKRYHAMGCIINLSWHAVQPPHAEDNATGWELMHDGAEPETVDRILTPGSDYERMWLDRLDNIAGYIKQLRDARIPVLWRPFHEMNGGWFWWGKLSQDTMRALWKQMFDRFVERHGLNNIIWNYSPNIAESYCSRYEDTFPGYDLVDIVSHDVYEQYGHRYTATRYDELVALADGRPIGIGENGTLPPVDMIAEQQPLYSWWVTWNGFEGSSSTSLYEAVYEHPFTLTQGEFQIDQTSARPLRTFAGRAGPDMHPHAVLFMGYGPAGRFALLPNGRVACPRHGAPGVMLTIEAVTTRDTKH